MASFRNRYDYIFENPSFKKEKERLSKTNAGKAINAAYDTVTAPFDFILWMRENWQITIVAAIAIIVLMKR